MAWSTLSSACFIRGTAEHRDFAACRGEGSIVDNKSTSIERYVVLLYAKCAAPTVHSPVVGVQRALLYVVQCCCCCRMHPVGIPYLPTRAVKEDKRNTALSTV